MSIKEPLTPLERSGLEAHNLPTDTPSQLTDAFRLGIAWVLREKAMKELAAEYEEAYRHAHQEASNQVWQSIRMAPASTPDWIFEHIYRPGGGFVWKNGDLSVLASFNAVMKTKSRAEHLQWAKERALQYVDANELEAAFTTMASDLQKHKETAGHVGVTLGLLQKLGGHLNTQDSMRDYINGFN
jgi:hypothetical protein